MAADQDQDLDRNEAATPYKLEKARERGQVPRSVDVNTAVVLSVAVVALQGLGWDGLRSLFRLDRLMLAELGHAPPTALLHAAASAAMSMLGPFLFFVAVAAIVSNLAQTGPVFSLHPITPDASRLSPVKGFQRLMSSRSAFDLVRSILKLLLLTGVLVLSLKSAWPGLQQLAGRPPMAQLHALVAVAGSIGVKLVLALVVIAAVDYAFTVRQFASRMRMSRREMKEEVRHREGDPRIRARLRDLRRAMLKRSAALGRTRDADVLITNPTHYAVALQYRHGEMSAPRVVAKGIGAAALAMRLVASRHHVPIVQNRSLARALHAELDIDHPVPPRHFAAVARIMVWVMARRRPAAQGASA